MLFWQTQDPVRTYLMAFQSWAGAPKTGVWDLASHAALYRLASQMNKEISPTTPWGAEPDKTVNYIIGLVDEADDETSFQFARPLLVALGFPAMTFEDSAKWAENLDPKDAEALTGALKGVAEAVGQAESIASVAPTATPIDPQPAAPGSPDPQPAAQANSTVSPTPATPATPAPTATVTPVAPAPVAAVPLSGSGMAKKTKVIIGVVGGVALVTIGTLAYVAFRKPKAPAMGGFEDFDPDMSGGVFGASTGECPCNKKGKKR